MKKLISAFTMMFLCSISYAESMKFITVLSSPVGTFNKLEAVDPDQPAKGNTVNFCTSIGTQGLVELKGTKPAALTTVSLAKNTTLGKTDEGKFSLNKIELHSGGSIRGGRLFGNIVTVNNAASGKANNLYGNQLTVVGAKTNDLTVANASYIKRGEQNSAVLTDPPDMVWSNQYQSDDACKENGSYEKCKQQYLLKSGGGSSGGDCSNVAYKGTHKSECCPSARVGDSICYTQKYVWKETLWYIGDYKHIVVSTASSCTRDWYNGSGNTVYPVKFKNLWQYEATAPSCFSQGISAGQECDPSVAKNSHCYIGLMDSWITNLKAYYKKYNMTFATPTLDVDTTGSGSYNVGCVWSGVTRWPQLECSSSPGEYIKNG
ncbi:MAG: hypothetical protein J6J74_08745, partial [Elusimicrobiaceae bacterium]|nr:hypothetical protein [Elusimicrobiaceae bacterium]